MKQVIWKNSSIFFSMKSQGSCSYSRKFQKIQEKNEHNLLFWQSTKRRLIQTHSLKQAMRKLEKKLQLSTLCSNLFLY